MSILPDNCHPSSLCFIFYTSAVRNYLKAVKTRATIWSRLQTPHVGHGVASEWSIPLMTGMHRSGPRQGSQRIEAAGEADPGLSSTAVGGACVTLVHIVGLPQPLII